jgi:Secretion system C-terminal sorting domain
METFMSVSNNTEENFIDVTNHIGDKAILKIYNRLGNTLKLIETDDSLNRIDISDIPEGTYFITMMYGTKSKTMRFTKN